MTRLTIGSAKLAMEDSVYNREVARMLPIGVYQRLYYPGCFLKRLISLNGRQRCGTSPFLEALALKKKWFSDFNVFKERNLVTRYAALKGRLVNEYAEREDQRKIELEHFKAFISATTEFRRPLWNNNGEYVPRWFDTIASCNEDEYNYDVENTRDWGVNVGINGRKLDITPFDREPKLLGAIVWHVKHGMSGSPSESVYEVATLHQESRIERTDLMDALECCWALAHIDGSVITGTKIDHILNKYQVGYKDDGERRTYGISLLGLSHFANDYRHYYRRWKMNTDKRSIKGDMQKGKIRLIGDRGNQKDIELASFKWRKPAGVTYFPGLDNSIRAYTFEVEGDDKILAESQAMKLLLTIRDFIEAYKRDFRQD